MSIYTTEPEGLQPSTSIHLLTSSARVRLLPLASQRGLTSFRRHWSAICPVSLIQLMRKLLQPSFQRTDWTPPSLQKHPQLPRPFWILAMTSHLLFLPATSLGHGLHLWCQVPLPSSIISTVQTHGMDLGKAMPYTSRISPTSCRTTEIFSLQANASLEKNSQGTSLRL